MEPAWATTMQLACTAALQCLPGCLQGETHTLLREDDCIGIMPRSGATAADIPQLRPVGDRVLIKVARDWLDSSVAAEVPTAAACGACILIKARQNCFSIHKCIQPSSTAEVVAALKLCESMQSGPPQLFDSPMKHVDGAVQVQEQASVTAGGLMLPENAREKPISGTVVRVGPGKKDKDGTRKTPKVCFHRALLCHWYGSCSVVHQALRAHCRGEM